LCFVLVVVLLYSLVGVASAAKPYIKSVTLSKDPVIVDQEFKIKIKVRNVESSMQVVIYFDDSVFPAKTVNVGPDLLDTEAVVYKDEWGVKVDLKCGVHTLRAYLVKFGEVYDTLTDEFDVGNVPIMVLDPARPNPGKSMKISFTDRDTGDVLKNLDVTITDTEKNTENKDTDSAGYLIYTPSKPGKYELEITETKYCGEMYFYAKRNITLDGPKPESPMAGDMITIAVPSSDISLKVYDSNEDFYLAARTSITGAINFTISDPGEYLLVIGETSTRYWGINKTLTVSGRPSLSVDLEPSTPYVKLPVTISVKAGGSPLANTKVKIITPAGVQREYVTLANGKVIYDGVNAMGEYTVIVEKEKYEPITKTFNAKNGFRLQFDPEMPMLNSQLTVTVLDQDGIFVPDAQVNIPEAQVVGATDSKGKYSFKLAESNPNVDPGEYTLEVKKDMFWDLTQKIRAQDTLQLSVVNEAEVDSDVNVELYNSRGGLVGDDDVSLKITNPDNTITSLNKASVTFKPPLVGDYTVEASKNNYISTSASVKVTPHPLSVGLSIEGKELFVEVRSHNNSVEGIGVSVIMPGGKVSALEKTDSKGMAKVPIYGEGNVSIIVNRENANPLYETKTEGKYIKKSYRILLLVVVVAGIVIAALLISYSIWYVRTLPSRRDRDRFEAKKGGGGLARF